jgi:hypothetical protein
MAFSSTVAGYQCEYSEEQLWLCEQISRTEIHVHPMNDWQDHILTRSCHCVPKVTAEALSVIVSHNSFDGREAYEKLESMSSGFLNH